MCAFFWGLGWMAQELRCLDALYGSVPNDEKRVCNICVSSFHHSAHQVVYHGVVLILSGTVVRVKFHICFP